MHSFVAVLDIVAETLLLDPVGDAKRGGRIALLTHVLLLVFSDRVLHSDLPLRGPHHPAGQRGHASWSL